MYKLLVLCAKLLVATSGAERLPSSPCFCGACERHLVYSIARMLSVRVRAPSGSQQPSSALLGCAVDARTEVRARDEREGIWAATITPWGEEEGKAAARTPRRRCLRRPASSLPLLSARVRLLSSSPRTAVVVAAQQPCLHLTAGRAAITAQCPSLARSPTLWHHARAPPSSRPWRPCILPLPELGPHEPSACLSVSLFR
jgi:hypothetical protein